MILADVEEDYVVRVPVIRERAVDRWVPADSSHGEPDRMPIGSHSREGEMVAQREGGGDQKNGEARESGVVKGAGGLSGGCERQGRGKAGKHVQQGGSVSLRGVGESSLGTGQGAIGEVGESLTGLVQHKNVCFSGERAVQAHTEATQADRAVDLPLSHAVFCLETSSASRGSQAEPASFDADSPPAEGTSQWAAARGLKWGTVSSARQGYAQERRRRQLKQIFVRGENVVLVNAVTACQAGITMQVPNRKMATREE